MFYTIAPLLQVPDAQRMLMSLRVVARERASGGVQMPPKQSIHLVPGHFFQTMSASSSEQGIAICKWIGLAVDAHGRNQQTHAYMLVSELNTARLLAAMDASALTLQRTVALSLLAFDLSCKPSPATLGFIGTGQQASEHLKALLTRYPGVRRIYACARQIREDSTFVHIARAHSGTTLYLGSDPDPVLAQSDVIVTTVPNFSSRLAFLDLGKTQEHVFVSTVDLGRSWNAQSVAQYATHLITDDLPQTCALIDSGDYPLPIPHHADLPGLVDGRVCLPSDGRWVFSFAGCAYADLAAAVAVLATSTSKVASDAPSPVSAPAVQ